jgi:hypothetical protein
VLLDRADRDARIRDTFGFAFRLEDGKKPAVDVSGVRGEVPADLLVIDRLGLLCLEKIAKELKARLYPYHIRSFYELGGTKFLHGYMYNVQAIRDHAETYGQCVIAHLHRVGWCLDRTIHRGS